MNLIIIHHQKAKMDSIGFACVCVRSWVCLEQNFSWTTEQTFLEPAENIQSSIND